MKHRTYLLPLVLALLLLLSLADEELRYTQDELVDLGYGLADGSLDFGYLRIWIKTHKI